MLTRSTFQKAEWTMHSHYQESRKLPEQQFALRKHGQIEEAARVTDFVKNSAIS